MKRVRRKIAAALTALEDELIQREKTQIRISKNLAGTVYDQRFRYHTELLLRLQASLQEILSLVDDILED
ncbi:MAG: hypothetical protein GF409_00590 [Candidatus Omnitrophica bacterium]|nr:hypothetical protein [Candidatus Omnitrophota bacterium]